MMNLLYDHQAFSLQQYGGISRYYYELITRLCQVDDIKIDLFLGAHINEYRFEPYRDKFGRFWGLKHRPVSKTVRLFSVLNQLLLNAFYDTQRQYVYHATYYGFYAPKLSCKRVVTVYDMIHELYPQHYSPRDATARNKQKIVLNSDVVICISQSTKQDLMKIYNVREEKIKVIYLANSLNVEVKSPRVVDGPYLLYVGQRGGYKNYDMLLTAYARMEKIKRDFKLVCFGGGQFKAHERSLIASLGLGDKVIHCSGTDEVSANLYKYASAFIYPSLYEGFGIPPLEAMHYGCPVLASRVSSIPEVVGAAGLYFNPGSLDDLIYSMDRVVFDSSLREQLTQAGYRQESMFDWDVCAKNTLQVYRGL